LNNFKKGVLKTMFEIYKPRGEKAGKASVVSLSKNSLTLNKTSRELLNHPESIELAYDSESNMIRIRPAENGSGQILKKTKIFLKGFKNHFGYTSIVYSP
jgi:hypothetical protein